MHVENSPEMFISFFLITLPYIFTPNWALSIKFQLYYLSISAIICNHEPTVVLLDSLNKYQYKENKRFNQREVIDFGVWFGIGGRMWWTIPTHWRVRNI